MKLALPRLLSLKSPKYFLPNIALNVGERAFAIQSQALQQINSHVACEYSPAGSRIAGLRLHSLRPKGGPDERR